MSTQTIEVRDVAGVEHLSIPVQPGVVLIRGPNDGSKSLTLEGISKLLGGKMDSEITCRDGTLSGTIEGLGAKVVFKRSARRSGDLEARSLEDRFSIADLVDPKLKSPEAADRARIKALLQVTGAAADVEMFRDLVPDDEGCWDAVCTPDVLKCDDPVEMAAKIRRNLQDLARKSEDSAEKSEGQALSCKQATDGLDLDEESDADVLQAVLEDAISAQNRLIGKASTAKEIIASAMSAREKIEKSTPPDVQKAEIVHTEAQIKLNGAQHEVLRLERELASEKAALAEAKSACENARDALVREQSHADTYAAWQEAVKAAENVGCPDETEIGAAAAKVHDCRKAIETGAVVRAAKEKATEAEKHSQAARAFRTTAESLRAAAKATDEVLSQAVSSDVLTVKAGRLVTQHPQRGEVYFADRSTGTRWKLAVGEAVKRVVQLPSEHPPIVLMPQECWGELDPSNKKLISDFALEQGVMILGVEATDGELRAEAF